MQGGSGREFRSTRSETYNNALKDFVNDAGQHSLVVVSAQRAVQLEEPFFLGLGQDTHGDIHHLQV